MYLLGILWTSAAYSLRYLLYRTAPSRNIATTRFVTLWADPLCYVFIYGRVFSLFFPCSSPLSWTPVWYTFVTFVTLRLNGFTILGWDGQSVFPLFFPGKDDWNKSHKIRKDEQDLIWIWLNDDRHDTDRYHLRHLKENFQFPNLYKGRLQSHFYRVWFDLVSV